MTELTGKVKGRKGFLITDHMLCQMDGFCDVNYVLADGKLHAVRTVAEIAALGNIHR